MLGAHLDICHEVGVRYPQTVRQGRCRIDVGQLIQQISPAGMSPGERVPARFPGDKSPGGALPRRNWFSLTANQAPLLRQLRILFLRVFCRAFRETLEVTRYRLGRN